MRPLKFRYARAVNLMCFGEEGVEFYFTDYDNIIRIRGINLDNPGTKDEPASNGSGKSTVQDVITVCLFGESTKDPTGLNKEDLLNSQTTGPLIAEVQFDDYRIVRTIRRSEGFPTKIQIWKSADHIWDKDSELPDLTSITKAEAKIREIIGLNLKAFCSVAVFDDADKYAFLEASTGDKRKIIENLLALDEYKDYHETAKAQLKAKKEEIANLTKEYVQLQSDVAACDARIKKTLEQEQTWKSNKTKEIHTLTANIKEKQSQLEHTDFGEALLKYEKAQEDIKALRKSDAEITENIAKKEAVITGVGPKLDVLRKARDESAVRVQTISLRLKELETIRLQSNKLLDKLSALTPGCTCNVCFSVIDKNNYQSVIDHEQQKVAEAEAEIVEKQAELITEKADFGKHAATIKQVESSIETGRTKIAELRGESTQIHKQIATLAAISKPENSSTAVQVLEAKISELKKQVDSKREELAGNSPYKEILEDAEREKSLKEALSEAKDKETRAAEGELPYYTYWYDAFGDNGIRKFVVDGVIPALNTRVNYWLQYLIDNKIEINFDNSLKDTITRSGVPAKYKSMSKSEKRRINLAVSQAFAYIMMINCGTYPSIIFLDEITGGIDKFGISGLYAMILELAKERQVLVTTHDQTLISLLQGCDTINLQKKDDVTTLLA